MQGPFQPYWTPTPAELEYNPLLQQVSGEVHAGGARFTRASMALDTAHPKNSLLFFCRMMPETCHARPVTVPSIVQ